ncbi:MAG: exported protein of unknown function [Promethearchaeota archaeon]|nr:MAG: exported protein of unknown function [Candidatus Lokiarchaeota archaeon]
MKKKFKMAFIALSLIFLFGLANLKIFSDRTIITNKNDIEPSNSEVKVVATTHVLRDFAQEVIGDEGIVSVIIESGSCPGHYDYPPSDINIVQDADIVFYHGFEGSGLMPLLQSAGNSDAAFGMIQNSSIGWPDQWGSPENAPKFVEVICSHLNETYPSLTETFNDNKDGYLAKLEGYKTYFEMKINTTYQWNNTKAYVMKHQKAFMNWIGFNVSGPSVWTMDDNSMTPSDIQHISGNASDWNAEIMVGNYHSGTDIGKEIADDLGIESAFLLNFPGVYGVKTYIEQLEFNVALLNHVLNGGPDPRPSEDGGFIGVNLLIPLVISFIACIGLIIYKKKESLFQ